MARNKHSNPLDQEALAERIKQELFHEKKSLAVLVEDKGDNRFWKAIIEATLPQYKDELFFPGLGLKTANGSSTIKRYAAYADNKMILCVDSDSIYLYENQWWYTNQDFIFHTWLYAKESFQFQPECLDEVVANASNGVFTYDFESLLKGVSNSLFPFLVHWVHHHQFKYQQRLIFTKEALEGILDTGIKKYTGRGSENDVYQTIDLEVEKLIDEYKASIDTEYDNPAIWDSIEKSDIPEVISNLATLSVNRDNAIFYCNGHKVMGAFIIPFMNDLISLDKETHLAKVNNESTGISVKTKQNEAESISNQYDRCINALSALLHELFLHIVCTKPNNKAISPIHKKLLSDGLDLD